MSDKKAKEIFAIIGFADMVVPIEKQDSSFTQDETYLIGYQDEEGNECDENGIYLNKI